MLLQTARDPQPSYRPRRTLGFRKKGILLIDDDPSFCRLMQTVSDARGVPMTTVAALNQLASLGSLAEYDILIVDYNLEAFTGLEIAAYVDAFFGDLPVMIVSVETLENASAECWPFSIRRFVNKAFGPFAIVQRALKLIAESHDERGSPPLGALAAGFNGRIH